MDIKSLRLFLTLADSLHFGQTGERLHMSLSSVSRSLQKLEDVLGQRLFDRDNRSVRLTPAGVRFRAYARGAVAEWDQVRDEFRGQEVLAGELSVFCSVTATHAIISPILEQFRHQYPRVEIKLHTGDQADAIQRVSKGIDDVAIAARGEDLPDKLTFSGLQRSPLQFICPTVACSVSETLSGVTQIEGASDWLAMPLIIAERGLARKRLWDWLLHFEVEPRIYAQVAGHEAIVSMVALGLGVGVVPQLVIDNSPFRDKVRTLQMSPPLQSFEVGLCATSQRLESPLIQAFWNVAKASYGASF